MYTDAAFLSLLVLFIFLLACCFTHIHTKEVRKEYSINGKLPQNRVITFFSLTITIANWFVRFLFCTNFLQSCKKEGKSCTTIESTRFIFRIYIYILSNLLNSLSFHNNHKMWNRYISLKFYL